MKNLGQGSRLQGQESISGPSDYYRRSSKALYAVEMQLN
jgi:hypothetical protein